MDEGWLNAQFRSQFICRRNRYVERYESIENSRNKDRVTGNEGKSSVGKTRSSRVLAFLRPSLSTNPRDQRWPVRVNPKRNRNSRTGARDTGCPGRLEGSFSTKAARVVKAFSFCPLPSVYKCPKQAHTRLSTCIEVYFISTRVWSCEASLRSGSRTENTGLRSLGIWGFCWFGRCLNKEIDSEF